MNKEDEDAIIRHVSGATVVHQSPFSVIEVPSVRDLLSEEECEKWVVPFYRVSFRNVDSGMTTSLSAVYPKITPAIVERLLIDHDWRPRLTGAFFAALKGFESLEDHIGRLLLRSDLCYAGRFYCVALAEFNTSLGWDYLKTYLAYYLTRPDLDYDQRDALGAIAYLDAKNGTKHFDSILPAWNNYIASKSWAANQDPKVEVFSEEMKALHRCRASIAS